MGKNLSKPEPYKMNIFIIGNDMKNLYDSILHPKKKNNITKCWNIKYIENGEDINSDIISYFGFLEALKKNKTQDIRETLIVKIKNMSSPEINLIVECMNKLKEAQYMPLVLLLLEEEYSDDVKIEINEKKYKRIDPRLIFISKYSDNPDEIEKEIYPKLLRICSIHNELGDRFSIGEGDDEENYDLIENYYPFNLNIACIGRFGQGKSTGVNCILNEYKAKESSKGCSQTKEITFYQISDQPVRILDIPGFEDEETIKKTIEKFKMCNEKINKMKDNLHIILYFLKKTDDRTFQKMEYPIFEELAKHKTSKLIYVITHSPPNMDDDDKEEYITKINDGIQGITEGKEIYKETQKDGLFLATLNNVIFVNFHKELAHGDEPFGKDDLFQKIHDFFIESEDYISSRNKLNPNIVEQKALQLREEGKDLLLSNKIGGGIVGIIPGVDWLLQKFVIKKNAAKKLGRLFGIDVKFVEENAKLAKKNSKKTTNPDSEESKSETIEGKETKDIKEKNTKNKADYINSSIDEEQLAIKGEELTKESSSYVIGNSIKVGGEAGAYVGGGTSIGIGITEAASSASSGIASAVGTTLQIVGAGCFIVGALVGIALGGYFTYSYCEQLLDKFVNYYKENAEKIGNSYNKAADYFNVKNKK